MPLNTITFKSKPLVFVNTAVDNAMFYLRFHLRFYGGIRVTHLFGFICHVLLFVFTSRVPCSDLHYDFHIKTMFGSSLLPVVCRSAHVLFTLFVFVCI